MSSRNWSRLLQVSVKVLRPLCYMVLQACISHTCTDRLPIAFPHFSMLLRYGPNCVAVSSPQVGLDVGGMCYLYIRQEQGSHPRVSQNDFCSPSTSFPIARVITCSPPLTTVCLLHPQMPALTHSKPGCSCTRICCTCCSADSPFHPQHRCRCQRNRFGLGQGC